MQLNFEEDVVVNQYELDKEWVHQPLLMIAYGQSEARAKLASDMSKERVEVIRASLSKNIRENPQAYDLSKVTETAIENNIQVSDEYLDAVQKMLDARYEYELARAATTAIATKKEALENLVKLYGMQYFADPVANKEDTDKILANKEKEQQVNVAKRLNKKSKEDN